MLLILLWLALDRLLLPSIGLTHYDEGLYLISADPPSPTAHWGFPWGWHSGILFRAVGYDIALWRLISAFGLVVAAIVLGGLAASFGLSTQTTPITRRLKWITIALGGAIGAVSSLLFYGGYLRSPGYNWVNLVGLTVSMSGTIALAMRIRVIHRFDNWCWAFSIVVSLGLFFTFPAKPTTLILQLPLGLLVIAAVGGLRIARRAMLAQVAGLLLLLVLAVATGVWSRDFIDIFMEVVQTPTLTPQHTLSHAVQSLVMAPASIVVFLVRQPLQIYVLLILGIAILDRWIFQGGNAQRTARGLLTLTLAAVLIGTRVVETDPNWMPRLSDPSIAAAGIVIVVAYIGAHRASGRHRRIDATPTVSAGRDRSVATALLMMVAGPFVFGFGSYFSPLAAASLATMFFFVAAVTVAATYRPSLLLPTSVLILISVVIVTGQLLVDSREHPHGMSPIDEHDTPIQIGGHNSELLVSSDMASELGVLRSEAADSGWVPGTRLLPLTGNYFTLTYLLDATPPPTLAITYEDQPGSDALALHKLKRLNGFETEAWLAIRNTTSLTEAEAAVQTSRISQLNAVTCMRFPQDYELAATSTHFELWKPTSALVGSDPWPTVDRKACGLQGDPFVTGR